MTDCAVGEGMSLGMSVGISAFWSESSTALS